MLDARNVHEWFMEQAEDEYFPFLEYFVRVHDGASLES